MTGSAPSKGHISLALLARQVADARKSQLSVFTDPAMSVALAMDLMAVPEGDVTPGHREFGRVIADAHADGLRKSTLFVADQDMSNLIDTAAPSMPDQILLDDDAITPHGLLMWADALPDRTGAPPLIPVEMLSWTTVAEDAPILNGKRGPAILITAYVRTELLLQAHGAAKPSHASRYLANATVMWMMGTEIGTAYGQVPGTRGLAAPGFYQRLLAAFWTLAKQPLSVTTDSERPLPSDRKRFARAGIENPGEPVHLVALRHPIRERTEVDSDTGRHINVRYVVAPYWRDTYYGKEGVHRQQLVAGSVRGPQGAPLRSGERVLLVTAKGLKP